MRADISTPPLRETASACSRQKHAERARVRIATVDD